MHSDYLDILCVEDDSEIRTIVALSLALDDQIGMRIVPTGTEALELLSSGVFEPDCVLLDRMMPDMHGQEVLNAIRDLPYFADLPVIFLTASGHTPDDPANGGRGALGTIRKPFDPLTLADQIRAMLAKT